MHDAPRDTRELRRRVPRRVVVASHHRGDRVTTSFLRQLAGLAVPYWNAEHRTRVRAVTALLLALTLAQAGLAVWTTFWHRALFDALEQRAVAEVVRQVGVFAVIFLLTIAVTAAHLHAKRWLQLDWRRWLTDRLVGHWMDEARHHRLQAREGAHDNPDARIAEDVRIATDTAVTLGHSLFYALISVALFVDILWTLSGSMRIPGTSLYVPGYLVVLAFAYAGFGAVLGWRFGRPIVRSTDALQSAEADFRFGLSRTREHSESIALLQGEAIERSGSTGRFRCIIRDWHRQTVAYTGIVGFSTGYGALLPVFPILVAAPQYVLGAMSLGALMAAAQAFQRLTSALSWLTDHLGEIAKMRASVERVLSLQDAMAAMDSETGRPGAERIARLRGGDTVLRVDGLTLADADGRPIVERASLRVRQGERVLAAGDPATTRAVFRALGGLWPRGSGRIAMPERAQSCFVPQRPYLPEGTLRAALAYPYAPDAHPTEALVHALENAGVGDMADRLDQADQWMQALPPCIQQRLAIARVFLQRPAWIVMEDATGALDASAERRLLEALRRELPDSGWLTFARHARSEALHDRTVAIGEAPSTPGIAVAATGGVAIAPVARVEPAPRVLDAAGPVAQSNFAGSQPRSTLSRKHQAGVVSVL
jgi:putative ATP-binding cassette transporter